MTDYHGQYGTLDHWTAFALDSEYLNRPALEFMESIAREGCAAFRAARPEPLSETNAQVLLDWLEQRNVPATRKNLEIAFRVLEADGRLDLQPVAPDPALAPVQKDTETYRVEGRLAAAQPTVSEAAELKTVKDDPTLSDRTRKNRDAKLRDLAHEQRRVRRDAAGITHV